VLRRRIAAMVAMVRHPACSEGVVPSGEDSLGSLGIRPRPKTLRAGAKGRTSFSGPYSQTAWKYGILRTSPVILNSSSRRIVEGRGPTGLQPFIVPGLLALDTNSVAC
jgi:hypothetical protein